MTFDAREAFDAMADAVLLADAARKIIYANEAAAALFGARREALVGLSLDALVPGSSEAAFAVSRADGEPRFATCRTRAQLEAGATLLVFHDVTETQRSQQRLVAARDALIAEVEGERAKMRLLLERLPAPVVIYTPPDFRISLINEQFRALFGGEDSLGKPLLEAFPGASTVHAMLEDVCRTGEPRTRREYLVKRRGADGSLEDHFFTSHAQPLFDDAGRVREVLAVGFDVTHEVRARRALSEAAERLRVVLDEMPVGVNVRDCATGATLMTNKASAEILGADVREKENPETWNIWEARFPDGRLLGPDDHAFRRVILSGQPVRNQIVVLRRASTGEELVVRSSAAPVVGEGGVALVVSIFDDITAEHRLLAEREQTARFAEMFVGILGHDLRGPLNAIAMAASLLSRQTGNGSDELKRIRLISSSADRMARMVDQLLDLTRVRLAGGIPISRRTEDLVGIVASALDELAAAWPEARLLSELPPALAAACDADRLAQVAANLIGNAIEHGDRTRPVRVALTRDGAEASLRVHSEGAPIPASLLPVLFDPFRRGPRETAARGGLGLGLYITREIARAHGGDVRVSSTAAEGTTFIVTLPVGEPA